VANESAFLVEDFLGAIASQLDRTQDALALKAVNRPLTYAIKDFTMELKVFVDLDPEGRVRFRSSGANEPGASSVHIGFTTITRPMIEENTAELAMTRGPSLGEAGLSDDERRRLEHIGVRTTAELTRLKGSAGTAGISRLADIPLERLKAALSFGRPQVRAVRPVAPPRAPAPRAPQGSVPATPSPRPPAQAPAPRASVPATPSPRPPAQAPAPRANVPAPPAPRPAAPPPRATAPTAPPPPVARPAPPRPVAPPPVRIAPSARRIEVVGRDLIGVRGAPQLRLGGRPLTVAEADDERIVAELPEDGPRAGTLEIDHGDGDVVTYELGSDDPWAP
jgi:hypothetical protein